MVFAPFMRQAGIYGLAVCLPGRNRDSNGAERS